MLYVCMYECMDEWMDVWMYVCMYEWMYMYMYISAYVSLSLSLARVRALSLLSYFIKIRLFKGLALVGPGQVRDQVS